MSLSYVPLKPVKVIDPLTNVAAVNEYAVVQGGSQVSFKAYTSTSISTSSIQFSAPPPSAQILVDRSVKLSLPVRLTFAGKIVTTNGSFVPNATLLNSGKDAPRAFPIAGSLDTIQLTINNTAVSINMSDVVHSLTRYNIDGKLRAKEYSQTPNYPDVSSLYSSLDGDPRNPLGDYGMGIQGDVVPRGGFPFKVVSNPVVAATTTPGTDATAVVDMLVTESLMLSPLFWGCPCENSQAFYNVNSFDANLTFLAAAAYRMWSHSDAAIATSGAISVFSNISSIGIQFNGFSGPAFSFPVSLPQLQFKYITPNVLAKPQLSPLNPYTYSYYDVTRFPTDIGTLSYAQGVTQYQSNNIQLNGIPKAVWVYARPNNMSLYTNATLTDTFLPISNISIQWANQSTLMSSATQQQLFAINCKNGSEQSWNEWSGQQLNNGAFVGTSGSGTFCGGGGPLMLEFGTDIQLQPNEAPGLSGQYQIQVQVGLSNQVSSGAWDAIPMTLYLVFANIGSFTIVSQGNAMQQLNVLSKNDILSAESQEGISYRSVQRQYGSGDFFSSLSNFASKINDFLKGTKIISTVASLIPHPIAQTIATGARAIGYGEGGCDGGLAIGGRMMTKAQLRRALMDR